MKLLKALNNNVALVLDDKRMESVVMGRGVAFNVKVGQHINSSLVEKHFVLNGRGGRKDFDSLLKRITVNDIELASNIIREGELRLGYQCNDSILLTLSDHLGLMMERAREGIYIGTPLEWDRISQCDTTSPRPDTHGIQIIFISKIKADFTLSIYIYT